MKRNLRIYIKLYPSRLNKKSINIFKITAQFLGCKHISKTVFAVFLGIVFHYLRKNFTI